MQLVATLIVAVLVVRSKATKMAETLDLSTDPDTEFFNSEDLADDGGNYTRYSAKDGYVIGKVIQGYNFIWERRSYLEESKYVNVYNRNNKPFLIWIIVVKNNNESNLYYMNTISTWSEIDESQFKDAKNKEQKKGDGDEGKFQVPFGTVSNFVTLLTTSLCYFYIVG